MDKQKIRQQYLLKRRQMSSADVFSKSERIQQKLVSLIDWSSIHSVHIYQSQALLNEVDTSHIIESMRANRPQANLTVGNPSASAPLPAGKYDVILVPLVVFDAQRNRLGFGGGWYDRFLAAQPQAVTIGLAYDLQKAPALPTESHDIRLSRIITDTGVI